jgi:hypothetical protein
MIGTIRIRREAGEALLGVYDHDEAGLHGKSVTGNLGCMAPE